MKLKSFFLTALTCLCLVGIWPSGAKAASITYKGISVTPAINQLVLNPDQPNVSYKIRLDNNQSYPVTLQASSLDFKSLSDTGGLAFIGSGAPQLEHKYGLTNWIDLPADPIVLPAGGGQFVNVTIENRGDLTPGGHYAAVLFKVISPNGTSGNNSVINSQIISSLFFVRKGGGEQYVLDLTKLNLHRHWAWFGWPNRTDLSFYNSGNVQTAPRGTIVLHGASNILNLDSSLVLPQSTRRISSDLAIGGSPFWPGYYRAAVTYQPDGGGAVKTAAVHLIYIGWKFPLALIIALYLLYRVLGQRGEKIWRRIRRWAYPTTRVIFRLLRYLLLGLAKIVGLAGKIAWRGLIALDTWGGKKLAALDKRRARKLKK